jgi:hypothetical protein
VEPSKTVGLIAVVLLVILATGHVLGEDSQAPATVAGSAQERAQR